MRSLLFACSDPQCVLEQCRVTTWYGGLKSPTFHSISTARYLLHDKHCLTHLSLSFWICRTGDEVVLTPYGCRERK